MNIYRCKLSQDTQKKLITNFLNGVSARRSAVELGINKNSSMLFYNKLKLIISNDGTVSPEDFQDYLTLFKSYVDIKDFNNKNNNNK